MKILKCVFIIAISLTLLLLMSGCMTGRSRLDEVFPSTIGIPPPSPFSIRNPGNIDDFRNEIITQITFAQTNSTHDVHDFESLTELYLVTVEIDGFRLGSVSIGKHVITYGFRSVDVIRDGLENAPFDEDWFLISIRRPEPHISSDETWRIVSEQMLGDDRGYLTEAGMIYISDSNEILSRIGDTWFAVRASESLSNYEFLRDLALEVIATSELIVLSEF